MNKTKNWAILGLVFLTVGFWSNLIALQAYLSHSPLLNVFGDVLPLELSIGDCFLLAGYGIFAFMLGEGVVYSTGGLVLKIKTRSKN